MLQVICTLITGLAAIAVAVVQLKSNKDRKASEDVARKEKQETEERAKLRARESRLSMDMMYATSKLCIGTALAVKRGKANGELDEGLEMVDRATMQYEDFLRDVTSSRIGA